ncbi:AzlD domain-containing protein [Pseudodesulfovibrio indicus]|uniref:AzlD domain-containing protein n=1 Tax=Pseudodesulfovibrio indicus TaxID=1716143 RepID=UPI00292DEE31|nr:AzlD domain-containing protein [Pseudodesulfovibrio indicus]
MSTYWPVVLILGGGTFLIRLSFILIVDRLTFPDGVTRALRFIPASVLTALIVPAVLLNPEAGSAAANVARPAAAVAAVAVAWRTRNIFATIAVGMVVLWLLQAVL